MMEILEYFCTQNKEHWLKQIKESDWSAGQYLYELLSEEKLKQLCGENTRVLMLADGEKLVSFCTYAGQDDVPAEELTPWVGFVYTFPQYRGARHVGKLLDYAYDMANEEGYAYIHISTGHTGLYEKYGYTFWKMMKDLHGEDSRIYRLAISRGKTE